jgi:hypothetical protein
MTRGEKKIMKTDFATVGRSGNGTWCLIAIAMWLGGCGGTSQESCAEGATQSCVCPDGTPSSSRCAEGQWQACSCSSPASPDMGCSGEIDTLGNCCSGDTCCAGINHSQANAGVCQCQSGYQPGPGFGSTSYVCQQSLPDLQVVSLNLDPWSTAAAATVYACINASPSGQVYNEGDIVEVENSGTAASGPYEVGIGLVDQNGDIAWASTYLEDPTGLPSNEFDTWTNSYCLPINTSRLPAGYYNLFAYADPNNVVAESNENNNVLVSPNSFYVSGD